MIEFSKLFGDLVLLLDIEPNDILGSLYMELNLGNQHSGQFFTPFDVSLMMAKITYGDQLKEIDKPFVTMSEPACGAGGMVLAFVRVMLSYGHNPAKKLWVQCIDVDRLASLMCYLQLSLWNVPAEIIIGNTLNMEYREVLYTPAHYLGNWDMKLQAHYSEQSKVQELEVDILKPQQEQSIIVPIGEAIQIGFDF